MYTQKGRTICQLYLSKPDFKQRTLLKNNHLGGPIKKKEKGRNKHSQERERRGGERREEG